MNSKDYKQLQIGKCSFYMFLNVTKNS